MVLTKQGFKKIIDIQIGDEVLTHNKTYCKVVNSMPTGNKKIYKIKGMAFDQIECTANHKFYVRKMVRHYPRYENGKRGSVRTFLNPEWVAAEKLDKSYYMGIAINQENIIPKWDGITHIWADGRKSRHKNNLAKYMNNSDFWWLIGRYVGDGWHRSQGGIIICAAHDEISEITEVADKLKMNYSIVSEKTVGKIHFADSELELFIEPFGRGAENKRIPGFVFDLPEHLIKSFVDGYVSADGTFTENRYKTSSVSRELSYGIGQCVAKAYKTPFSIYRNDRKLKSVIDGRTVNQKSAWQVVWKTETKKQDHAFYEDGYLWFPIQSINQTNEEKPVFDIEVESNHSFTANGVIAHNCTDISLAGRMEGMAKGSGTRSSLLWEVERILTELNELKSLPDILLMENVTAVHGKDNIEHFQEWTGFLSSLGYKTYTQDLNTADYGLPHHRERCFALSLLGDNSYHFPTPMGLTTCMEDYFEELSEEEALKQIVKSEKAMDLLVELDEKGELEED